MSKWSIKAQYMPRPMASAEAWVYNIEEKSKPWGILVDERIRYKTLFEPGQDCHEDLDEIIVPIEGRYWVKSGDWSRTLVPGEAAFIPKNTVHDSGTATNLIGTHFLVLLFDRNLNVLSENNVGGFRLPPGAVTWLRGAFRFLRQSPDQNGFLPLSVLPDFFKQIALGEKLGSDLTHPDPVVSQIVKCLEQIETPTLDELSIEVGLSPAHLQKRFKAALGFSPLQYANAWKLDAIAAQIKKGNELPLVELATEYGFNDQKHFRELFQRRFGVSPSTYRKNPPPQS